MGAHLIDDEHIDEHFWKAVFAELRDGEDVTVSTRAPLEKIRVLFRRLGATPEELARLTIIKEYIV